ncbi:MAG: hypothetical protein LUD27_08825 [Clostridia bacterium]|nr:hypothetical protein [Clostridia bacterium]
MAADTKAADTKLKSLEGKDFADYAREELPKGRWSDTWEVFKANFSKVVINNLLTLVFFVPLVAILYIRNVYVDAMSSILPFGANIGSASPHPTPDMEGLAEGLILSADAMFYSLAVVAALIASVGVAGCCYSMKKLVNTHGKFTIKSYFHGVKVCYLNTAIPVMFFSLVLFATMMVMDWKNLTIATGGSAAWPITAVVLMVILCVAVGLLCLWFIAVGVSYNVNPWQLVKNSCILLVGFIIQTIFIAAIALVPVWLLLWGTVSTFVKVITYMIFIVFGFSYVGIVWMSFTQWAFDIYITPSMEKEKEKARAQMTDKERAEEKAAEERRVAQEILAAGKSELVGRPVKPISDEVIAAVPKAFTRGDVAAAAASRAELQGAVASYEEEHKNDSVYVEYNKLFAEREKALQDTSKKGKKKKVSADNLLK